MKFIANSGSLHRPVSRLILRPRICRRRRNKTQAISGSTVSCWIFPALRISKFLFDRPQSEPHARFGALKSRWRRDPRPPFILVHRGRNALDKPEAMITDSCRYDKASKETIETPRPPSFPEQYVERASQFAASDNISSRTTSPNSSLQTNSSLLVSIISSADFAVLFTRSTPVNCSPLLKCVVRDRFLGSFSGRLAQLPRFLESILI
jgi:hypothetical protein